MHLHSDAILSASLRLTPASAAFTPATLAALMYCVRSFEPMLAKSTSAAAGPQSADIPFYGFREYLLSGSYQAAPALSFRLLPHSDEDTDRKKQSPPDSCRFLLQQLLYHLKPFADRSLRKVRKLNLYRKLRRHAPHYHEAL